MANVSNVTTGGWAPLDRHVSNAVVDIISLLILGFNSVVLYAIVKHRLCRLEYRFVFLTHMAVFDLMLGLGVIFTIPLTGGWISAGETSFLPICITGTIWVSLVLMGTLVNLLALTIEQYIRIAYPLHYHLLVTKGRIKATIVISWMLTIGHCLVGLVGVDTRAIERAHCTFIRYVSGFYLWYSALVIMLCPFAVMITLQVMILTIARRHTKRSQSLGLRKGEEAVQRPGMLQQWRIAVTTGIILGAVFVCWLPYFCELIIRIVKPEILDTTAGLWFGQFSGLMYFSNSCLNPIIYGVRVQQIKQEFVHILCKLQVCKCRMCN